MNGATRIEKFTTPLGGHEEVVYTNRRHELGLPTEEVMGEYEARGQVVWVALAERDALEQTGGAIHNVYVDPLGFDEVQALTEAIDKLTLVRAELLRLEGLGHTSPVPS
jgi:hypothetical protein